MKNKILAKYPNSIIQTTKSEQLFVADFKKRTNNLRDVEISIYQPQDPNDANRMMPCYLINNPHRQSLEYNIFDDTQFVDQFNNQLKHGECCLFPTINDGRSWFCIVEIKDCSVNQISGYKQDISEKAKSMFDIFKNEVGISNPIYFVASFPRNKTAFDQSMFDDYIDMKKYKKAHLVVSNSSTVIDNHLFDPYK